MIPLLAMLATCPALPADTVPLIPKALIWMSEDTAIVAAGEGVAYEYVNDGDSAVVIYKNCQQIARLKNTMSIDDTIPDPDQPPVWEGKGIKIVFVAQRRHPERGIVELVGVLSDE